MRKSVLNKQEELPAFNESFFSSKNMKWFYFVMSYLPPLDKPLVFLPCGSANKTRGKNGDPRKFISQGFSHQIMSKITRNDAYCKIILSEPLTLIPYDLESHPLRPDYNLPPDYLSIQSELIFMERVCSYLNMLKRLQPEREVVYFLGSTHHFLILHGANEMAKNPFRIIRDIPEGGLKDYAKAADRFANLIDSRIIPEQEDFDVKKCIEKFLKSRGRYTNKRFWHKILIMQKLKESEELVCDSNDYIAGFQSVYEFFA